MNPRPCGLRLFVCQSRSHQNNTSCDSHANRGALTLRRPPVNSQPITGRSAFTRTGVLAARATPVFDVLSRGKQVCIDGSKVWTNVDGRLPISDCLLVDKMTMRREANGVKGSASTQTEKAEEAAWRSEAPSAPQTQLGLIVTSHGGISTSP